MGTKPISQIEKVSTMNSNDCVIMNTADGSQVQIRKADLSEAMKESMKVSTEDDKGLMSANDKRFMIKNNSGEHTLVTRMPDKSTGFSNSILVITSTSTIAALLFISIHSANGADVCRITKVVDSPGILGLAKFYVSKSDGCFSLYVSRGGVRKACMPIVMNNAEFPMINVDELPSDAKEIVAVS